MGDNLPATSHKALQGCVVRLRKALGADAIETSAQGYRLTTPADRDFTEAEWTTEFADRPYRRVCPS